LAEFFNKNLIRIIRKTVRENKRAWDNSLKYALWADRVTKKQSTRKAPFELVYGIGVVLPINLMIPVHKLIREFTTDEEALHGRFDDLFQLEEDRSKAFTHFIEHQRQVKKAFDKRAMGKVLKVGDLVSLWDKRRGKSRDHNKFDSLCLCPFSIHASVGPNTFRLDEISRPGTGNLFGGHEGDRTPRNTHLGAYVVDYKAL
jgi:hypothetical protein